MARFSIGTAIGDAFGLMRRRPLSVFVWGALMVLPMAAGLAVMLPLMGDMVGSVATGAAAGEDVFPSEAFARMMQFQAASMLANVFQLIAMVVVYTAIMRAVVRPAEASVFSLRLGADELRIAVVGLAIGIGLYAVMLVLILFGAAIGFGAWGLGSPANWLIIVGLALILMLAVWAALARVSLIAPASVLHRTFAFEEGWRLGRGRLGPLFGLTVLITLIIIAFELVIGLVVVAAVIAAVGGGIAWTALDPATANPFAGMEAVFSAYWPLALIGVVVASAFYGVVITLGVAPFASACRQLAGADDVAST